MVDSTIMILWFEQFIEVLVFFNRWRMNLNSRPSVSNTTSNYEAKQTHTVQKKQNRTFRTTTGLLRFSSVRKTLSEYPCPSLDLPLADRRRILQLTNWHFQYHRQPPVSAITYNDTSTAQFCSSLSRPHYAFWQIFLILILLISGWSRFPCGDCFEPWDKYPEEVNHL